MSTVIHNNLKLLKEKYPEIYERTADIEVTDYDIIWSKVKGVVPNLRSKKTGRLFYNELNPYADAEQDLVRRKLPVTDLNIMLGCGLMYQVFALYNKYNLVRSTTVIIEGDLQIFKAALLTIDMAQVLSHNNIHFIVGEEAKGVFTKFTNLLHTTDSKFFVKSMNFIEQPVCFAENKDYYLNSVRAIKESVRETLMFFGNDPLDSLIGIENTFANIEEIIENPGIQDLKDAFKGKPGIVIATGPSLNKNIELLKGLENKAVMVGADASLRVLRKRGLKPHMVCSLERMTPTSKLFENLEPDDFENVYYSAAPVIHPQTYANYKGKRIIVYRNFATFKWLDIPKGTLDIGPSSGNMAFKILEYMGCDPIILIGQDLAFGEDGNTHAQGNTFGEKESHISYGQENTLLVEGNYVPAIKTTKVWNTFLNFYHRDASMSPAKVINATEGGAKIFGTEIMTFKEAVDKYINEDIDTLDVIREKLNYPTDEEKAAVRHQVYEKVVSGLDLCARTIQNFRESAEYCTKFLQEVWLPFQDGADYDENKVAEILEALEERAAIFSDTEFYNVLMHYIQSYFIRTTIEINSVDAEDIPEPNKKFKKINLARQMYDVMIRLTEKMVFLLEILKTRLEKDLI